MGRRVLVTGLSTFWGGRVAKALEADSEVDVIVGLDTKPPRIELVRPEFVRADQSYSILSRIVKAAQIDTILHTFLVVDSTRMSGRALHEINVIGTMNLLAAAGAEGSPVRQVVVKSSTLVYGATHRDPQWFREETPRTQSPRTRVERSLNEVEGYLRDFAEDNPHVTITLLRFSNVLGPDIVTPITKALGLPLVPMILGYDPMMQFVHEEDVVRSILFTMDRKVSGIYNVAGDGRMPWSEVITMAGKRPVYLPPIRTAWAAAPFSRLGIVDLPDEVLALLRYGRGADNRRLKHAGFRYGYTTAGAVDAFVKNQRLRSTVGETRPGYQYERDVENFFRHSPAVVRDQ
jgi:UDP-glucose 4-epimerase